MSLLGDKHDLGKLKGEVGEVLTTALTGIVEGAAEDIRAYGLAISSNMIEAKLAGDDDTIDRLLDQLKLLAEINSIRASAEAWRSAEEIVKAVLGAVLATALAAL